MQVEFKTKEEAEKSKTEPRDFVTGPTPAAWETRKAGSTLDPAGGFECSSAASLSTCGGRITTAGLMQEYPIRHAVPGTYQISCSASAPVTVRAVIHKNWGRPNHTFKVVTLWLEAGKPQALGEVECEFVPPE
ncbi:MAG: hypothetical protein WCO57_05070 [Verrucomicrobiota bacterium]